MKHQDERFMESITRAALWYCSGASGVLSRFCLSALAVLTALAGTSAQTQAAAGTSRPTLVVLSPISGQRFSNRTITLRGRANDDAQLEEVLFRVNSGEWHSAAGTAAWSATAELEQGANSLQAYAVNAAGIHSRTSSVRVTYVQTAPLTVQIIGKGQVVSNYNGKLLEVGRTYSMTAQAQGGFVFDHWAIGTNQVSSNAVVHFQMTDGLALKAYFADRTRPSVRITSPLQGQKVSPVDGQWVVRGTATDNGEVAQIFVKLNEGSWQSINAARSWHTSLALVPGRNTISAYALDAAGNRSATHTLSFTHVVKSALDLTSEGSGTIRKSFSGSVLEVGKTYNVTAVPQSGQILEGWLDGQGNLLSTSPSYTFTMQPNLLLRAKFIPNPFISVAGSYNGLFYPANDFGEMSVWADSTNSGGISFTLSTNGTVQGTINTEGSFLPFTAHLAPDLTGTVTVSQSQRQPLALALQVIPDEGAVGGTIARGEEWTSSVLARRRAANGSAFAGKYSFLMIGCPTGTCFIGPPVPFGDSIGTVIVKPTGALEVKGTLSDGYPLHQQTFVSENGYWPVLLQPYAGKGIVIGWMNLGNAQDASTVYWEKPITPVDDYYPNGFVTHRNTVVMPYSVPQSGHNALNWTNGYFVINSGNLPGLMLLTNRIEVVNNQVRNLGGDLTNFSMTISPSNGSFSGAFNDPVTGVHTSYKGLILQGSSEFFRAETGGWFLGTNTGGTIRLRPAVPGDGGFPAPNQLRPANGDQSGAAAITPLGSSGVGGYVLTQGGFEMESSVEFARSRPLTPYPPAATATGEVNEILPEEQSTFDRE